MLVSTFLQCDNTDCAKTFRFEDHHIALNVEGTPPSSVSVEGDEITLLAMWDDGSFVASTHFCSMACLASWAMAQHLEEAT